MTLLRPRSIGENIALYGFLLLLPDLEGHSTVSQIGQGTILPGRRHNVAGLVIPRHIQKRQMGGAAFSVVYSASSDGFSAGWAQAVKRGVSRSRARRTEGRFRFIEHLSFLWIPFSIPFQCRPGEWLA